MCDLMKLATLNDVNLAYEAGSTPLGEVIDGNQDELMTIGRFHRNLLDDVNTPY